MAIEPPENTSPPDVSPAADATATVDAARLELPDELIESDDDELVAFERPAGTALAARLGAEVLGSFIFVLASTGIALYSVVNAAADLGVALGSGIALAGATLAFGRVSGGHFNPAVTLGAACAGRIPWSEVVPYWLAQLVGAAIAPVVLLLTVPSGLPALLTQDGSGTRQTFFSAIANGYGTHSPLFTVSSGKASFTLVAALVIEGVLTAVLVAVYLGATDRRASRASAPFAIGLTFAVLVLIALPITNGSLNPARATATALFAASWARSELWAFWLAPLVGAAIAGLLYRAFATTPGEGDEYDDEANGYEVVEEIDIVRSDRS